MSASLFLLTVAAQSSNPSELMNRFVGHTWHTSLNLPDKYENIVTTYRKDAKGVITGTGTGQSIGERAMPLKSMFTPTADPKVLIYTDRQGETKLRGTVRREGEKLVILYGAEGKKEDAVREELTFINANRTVSGEVFADGKLVIAYRMSRVEPAVAEIAIEGKDPVLLIRGQSVAGKPSLTQTVGEFKYYFANAQTLAEFKRDPIRYSAFMGGACLNMGPMSGRGQPNLYEVYDGKLCLFASEGCRTTFLKAPAEFIVAPDQPFTSTADKDSRGRDLLELAAKAHNSDALTSILRVKSSDYKSGDRTLRLDEAAWSNFRDSFADVQSWENATFVSLSTPSMHWSGSLSSPSDFSKFERDFMARQNLRDIFAILRARKDKTMRVEYVESHGISTLKEARAVRVHLKGATTMVFIDPVSHLVRGVQYQGRLMRAGYQIVRTFDDLRDILGAKVPFKMTTLSPSGVISTFTYAKIIGNAGLAELPVMHPLRR